MVMNAAFATTVADVVPVILFAVGAELRAFEERTRDRRGTVTGDFVDLVRSLNGTLADWSRAMTVQEQLDLLQRVYQDLRGKVVAESEQGAAPNSGTARGSMRLGQIVRRVLLRELIELATLLWMGAFVLLIVVEAQNLYWIGLKDPGPRPDLALVSFWAVIGCSFMLFAVPLLRLYAVSAGSMPVRDYLALLRELGRTGRRLPSVLSAVIHAGEAEQSTQMPPAPAPAPAPAQEQTVEAATAVEPGAAEEPAAG